MSRRLAREIAFKTIFQIDMGQNELEKSLEQRLSEAALRKRDVRYVQRAVRGVIDQLPALDAQISAISEGWQVHRLGSVDRNILRLAVYEIVFMDEIPASVSVNEAVELAKKFSDPQSARFVNGLLGTVVRDGGFQ
ncbi:MAG: transcription antitermination factor NusB [Firmicutes bacterium]|nr:transcription antitermination factor NusB [Bacillota bacterium]